MKQFLIFATFAISQSVAYAQISVPPMNAESTLSRDSVRKFFGTYQFKPAFQMQIFSENGKLFARRIGDADKFQLFPKTANVFLVKTIPAELEFRQSTGGQYDVLLLRQGGNEMVARQIQAQPYELYDTILQLDSLMYDAYNKRNLPGLMAYFASELEFYHDQTGLTTQEDNRERFKANFAKATVMRRALVKSSLEVYPIDAFGAIQIGTHQFYQTDPGQPERLVSTPRFMLIWKNTGGRWQIVRAVSYAH